MPRVELLIFLFISKGGSKSSVLVGLCTPTPTPSSGTRKGLVPHCLLGLAVVPAAADLGVRILNWCEDIMVALVSQKVPRALGYI